jgi:hypothetical protein
MKVICRKWRYGAHWLTWHWEKEGLELNDEVDVDDLHIEIQRRFRSEWWMQCWHQQLASMTYTHIEGPEWSDEGDIIHLHTLKTNK